MINMMIELSKYILAGNLTLYVAISYLLLSREENKRSSFLLVLQNILMILHHIISTLVLASSRRDVDYLFLPLVELVCILTFLVLARVIYPKSNRLILNHIAMFFSIGSIFLLRLSFVKSIKQFLFMVVGLGIILLLPCFLRWSKLLYKMRWFFVIVGILLLGVVYVKGSTVNGAKLSITVAGFSFQASEFVKLSYALFLAGFFAKSKNFWQVLVTAVLAGVHVLLLVASRDLGSALIYFIVYFTVLFVATGKKRYAGLGCMAAVFASVVAYFLFSHVRVRVAVWLDPWTYIEDRGYQIAHSLFAIGTGGWFGLGIDGGTPTSIPCVEQDFIFASICEEYGAVFGIALFLLALNLFFEMIMIGVRRRDTFAKLTALGIGVVYIFQVFLTVGGNCKFIPMTGVTFPLISYGGSSLFTSIIMLGLMQGICMQSDKDELDCMIESEDEQDAQDTVCQKDDLKYTNCRIIGLAGIYGAIFISMLVYLGHYITYDCAAVIGNQYNKQRQTIMENKTIRGDILAADGTVLATTQSKDGKETREYPYHEVFAHAVGYASHGRAGAESLANIYLITSNSSLEQKLQDSLNNKKHQGDTVTTTFLPFLQEEAYKALGAYDGAVIVTNPQTGEILAMVSKPDYNPGDIDLLWEELIEEEDSSVLLNRVTQGLYPPGSTFKIITALEYIRENGSAYNEYEYDCNGSISYEGGLIHCYHGTKHKDVDFNKSFAKSCNSSFANIGLSLNRSSFAKTLEELLFDKALPIGMPYKSSHTDVSPKIEDKSLVQTVIGQGTTQITPIHLAMLTSMIANDGQMMIPYCIQKVENCDGRLIKYFEPKLYGQLISDEEAEILENMMIAVVEEGTATKLSGLEYKVAGKTGSAEYNSNSDSHAWFTGYTYGVSNPIQITVIVEGGGSGGEYAVPVARRIFDAYYNEYGAY